MASTCPNCSRPVRKSARFCGYCGADLNASKSPRKNDEPALQDDATKQPGSLNGKSPKRKRSRACCGIWYFLVLILCLAIIVTLILYYWQYINPLLGQILN
jgi:hypothetical protein